MQKDLEMSDKNNIFYLVNPYKKRFILAFIFLIMVAAFQGLLVMIIKPLMDGMQETGAGNSSMQELEPIIRQISLFIRKIFNIEDNKPQYIMPQLLLLSFLGQALFTFFSHYLMKTLGLKVIRDIRKKLYSNLIRQSIDFLTKAKTGDLVSRLSNDIDIIKNALSETLSIFIREFFSFIILLAIIFYRDWQMALITLILIPVAGALLYIFGKKVKKRGIQSQRTIGELSNFLSETVTGNKIVKAYNMEEYEINKFSSLNKKHYKINSKIAMLFSLTSPVFHSIGGVVAAIIFAIGMQRVQAGHLTIGEFTSFLTGLFMMYNPIKRLSGANNQFQQGSAAYHRILEILRIPVNEHTDLGTQLSKGTTGRVSFKDVSFSYNQDRVVLKHINLDIEPNKMIAIVGSSGAGKSTLMNLLLKFYQPSKGTILIDGIDILELSDKSLRDAIGLVTQEVFLFNDTIENNIAYGTDNYSSDELIKAARIARIYDHIKGLKNGFQTNVGEHGAFLSAGQRQRISIARAIIKNPRFLIFDEATSSLDSESEKYIQEAMSDIMQGRTSFVIAHRLSTIRKADMIIVLKDGEIVETGKHSDLLHKQGVYYSLYNLQFPRMDTIM
jgi:subfamily B ATP-binding cassette protein MsbA